MMSEARVTKIKNLKSNTLDEDFIRDFECRWNDARRCFISGIARYEQLYRLSGDFQKYVDSCMTNKDIALSDVLCMKTTRMISKIYEKELGVDLSEHIPELPKPKEFTIWKKR